MGNDSSYIWYTICVNTEKPRSEKHVDLSALVRKAIALDVQLHNPLEESTSFEVVIEGEYLMGQPIIYVNPQQTVNYELVFSPLKSFRGKGSLNIIHEKLGEIWYDLALHGQEN